MRYKFERDDDCHWYLIPEDKQDLFDSLLETGEEDYYAQFNNQFEEYRCEHPTSYTFTDPSF